MAKKGKELKINFTQNADSRGVFGNLGVELFSKKSGQMLPKKGNLAHNWPLGELFERF